MKRAFITGITGQNGSCLAALLLGKGYEVHGLVRRAPTLNRGRIDHLHQDSALHPAVRDLTDGVMGPRPRVSRGMWRMLQHDEPQDYVLATGVGYTLRQFCEAAFAHDRLNWEDHVTYDKQYERPAEVDALIGDASKAREVLGWQAEPTADRLAQIMVDADLQQIQPAPGLTRTHLVIGVAAARTASCWPGSSFAMVAACRNRAGRRQRGDKQRPKPPEQHGRSPQRSFVEVIQHIVHVDTERLHAGITELESHLTAD